MFCLLSYYRSVTIIVDSIHSLLFSIVLPEYPEEHTCNLMFKRLHAENLRESFCNDVLSSDRPADLVQSAILSTFLLLVQLSRKKCEISRK